MAKELEKKANAGAKPAKKSKLNLKQYLKEMWGEVKKLTWLSVGDLVKHTLTEIVSYGNADKLELSPSVVWETLILTSTPQHCDSDYHLLRLFKGKALMYRVIYGKSETFEVIAAALLQFKKASAEHKTGREAIDVLL